MTRFKSFCTTPTVPAKRAVAAPHTATTLRTPGVLSSRGDMRANRKTPAVTMVAAWIRADTGVGPSMASGSQGCKPSWADFPTAPPKRSRAIRERAWTSTPPRDTVALRTSALRLPKRVA